MLRALIDAGCEVRGDDAVHRTGSERIVSAEAEDWGTEYLAPILSVRMVEWGGRGA